jgi:putative transposase
MPHRIIQRGNRRLPTFFRDEDYGVYIDLMAEWCGKLHVEIWAYCLMPNHVHLVAPGPSEVMISYLDWKASLPESCIGGNPDQEELSKGIEYGVPGIPTEFRVSWKKA